MKTLIFCIFSCLTAVWGQSPVPLPPAAAPAPTLPDLPESTVIATFDDGVQVTMGEFRKIFAILPPQNQQMALRDRSGFLKQWAFMRKLSQMAGQQKLDQESPTKEALDYYHMMIMSQAKINDAVNSVTAEPGEIIKFYDVNEEKYKQVRVQTIYVSFTGNRAGPPATGGKKPLTADVA